MTLARRPKQPARARAGPQLVLFGGCWLALALLIAIGCGRRRPFADEDHEQRCLNGDQTACARACNRGIHGKGGCMAAVHQRNPVLRTKMFSLACDARQAGACSMAAEASITLGINDPAQYRKLLSRACEQKDQHGCDKLGDFLLADSLESAKVAYENGCRLDATRTPYCRREVTERIATIGEQLAACKRDDLAACQRLLVATAPRNHDLGYLGAEAICRLRGLTEYYRRTELRYSYKLRKRRNSYAPCGLLLLERAITDPKQSLALERVPLPGAPPRRSQLSTGRVTLDSVSFHFRDPPAAQPDQVAAFKTGVEAQVRERLELASRCYEQHLSTHPRARGQLDATFIVDKLGEPLELRASSELTDPALRACLLSAAIPERFAGLNADLGSIVRVEVRLALAPTPTSLQ